jgi:DinB superfamily
MSGALLNADAEQAGGERRMSFDSAGLITLLERTPIVLDALLRGLPDEWTGANEGGENWSAYDILGHLIHGERTDWMPRIRIIIEHGDSRAFDPFDRFAQIDESVGKDTAALLTEFADLRWANVESLRALNLTPAQLDLPGLHPALGPVTMKQLLSTWQAHDLNHIHQITRVLAWQQRESVGPWREYLGILRRG